MNNTGLMFENAGAFNALILFAEVRGVPYAQQHAWRCSPCLATLHNSPRQRVLYCCACDCGTPQQALPALVNTQLNNCAEWKKPLLGCTSSRLLSFGCCCLQHRYYGQTQLFGEDSWRTDPSFLTAEQAMADYATLLYNLTQDWGAADRCGRMHHAYTNAYAGQLTVQAAAISTKSA